MAISNCKIDNFTVLENERIEFCAGVNVIIGANGTGKSHLLKVLYALTQWMTEKNGTENEDHKDTRVHHLLNGLFKPENGDLSLLLRTRSGKAAASIALESEDRHYRVLMSLT